MNLASFKRRIFSSSWILTPVPVCVCPGKPYSESNSSNFSTFLVLVKKKGYYTLRLSLYLLSAVIELCELSSISLSLCVCVNCAADVDS